MIESRLLSVVVGRKAGIAKGLQGKDLDRLTLVSYIAGNPVLSLVAAKSMAKPHSEPGKPSDPKTDPKQDPRQQGSSEDSGASGDILKAREDAKWSAANSETSATKAADSATEAARSAAAAADSAKRAEAAAKKLG